MTRSSSIAVSQINRATLQSLKLTPWRFITIVSDEIVGLSASQWEADRPISFMAVDLVDYHSDHCRRRRRYWVVSDVMEKSKNYKSPELMLEYKLMSLKYKVIAIYRPTIQPDYVQIIQPPPWLHSFFICRHLHSNTLIFLAKNH